MEKYLIAMDVNVNGELFSVQFIVSENLPNVGDEVNVKIPLTGTVTKITSLCEVALPGPELSDCPSCYR